MWPKDSAFGKAMRRAYDQVVQKYGIGSQIPLHVRNGVYHFEWYQYVDESKDATQKGSHNVQCLEHPASGFHRQGSHP